MEDRNHEIVALKERLTRLSEASLSINDSLDPDAVLQKALDSARSLTGARYSLMVTLDESGKVEDFLVSGLTPEEAQRLWEMPGGTDLFAYLGSVPGPLRVADFAGYVRSMGLPDFQPPVPVGSFIMAPIRHRGDEVGSIYIANGGTGREFNQEDEEVMVMFASQAALVIANARRYREERRSRASLETLVDTTPVGVAVLDARTGAPVSFNREMARIVESLTDGKKPPEEILDSVTCRRADGRELPLMEWPSADSLAESLARGETVRAEEIVLSVPDGRNVTALVNVKSIPSGDGEPESYVVTLQDMTPLEDLERMRAEFLEMVSHELRTPLTSIRGSATTLQEASDDLDATELRQFLRIIVDQADNMRDLIDDLLDVTRIETGELPINPEPTEVVRLVDRARKTFLSTGGRHDLDITLEPELPLVMADRRRISQVIGNLLSNAARHSPQSAIIRVNAAREGLHVAISVTDEGRGIPAEQLPRLFRKFSRTGNEERAGDTGLGLAICKGVVEAHGGRIWAESDGPSLGARFTFTIPMAEEYANEMPPPAMPSRTEGKERESILVVDDDPHTLIYVRRALTNSGYNSMVAADAEEALSLLRDNQPRLVLLDMMLPSAQDGIDLMLSITRIAEVPVIFISAYGQDDIIARAFEVGAADYIVKPFSTTELVTRIKAALRRQEDPNRVGMPEPYVYKDLAINYTERRVTLAGQAVYLTAGEYDLLFELSINAGRVLSHDHLLLRAWPPKKTGNVRSLRTLMRRLRLKLGDSASNPTYIFAEPRVGYRMPSSQSPVPQGR